MKAGIESLQPLQLLTYRCGDARGAVWRDALHVGRE
jgi:hypothetical protein